MSYSYCYIVLPQSYTDLLKSEAAYRTCEIMNHKYCAVEQEQLCFS